MTPFSPLGFMQMQRTAQTVKAPGAARRPRASAVQATTATPVKQQPTGNARNIDEFGHDRRLVGGGGFGGGGGSGGYNPFALLDGLNPRGGDTDAVLGDLARKIRSGSGMTGAQKARALGYTVGADGSVKKPLGGMSTGAYEVQGGVGTFGDDGPGKGAGGLALLLDALRGDTARQKGAADRQFGRNNAEIDRIRQSLAGGGAELRKTGDKEGGLLDQAAGDLESLGAQQGEFDDTRLKKRIDGIDSKMNAAANRAHINANAAMKEGDNAVKHMETAIKQFADRMAQDASVVAAGIRKGASAAMQMARAGVRADGTPMSAAEQDQATTQIMWDTNQQVQMAVTPLMSQYNQFRAGLDQSLAQLRMNNAGVKLEGADRELAAGQLQLAGDQLGVQGELGIIDAQLKAGERQAALAQAGAQLRQVASQVRQAAVLNAVNLEVNGQYQLAQLVQQNPESEVSWFQGLMAIYSAMAAGGGGATRFA